MKNKIYFKFDKKSRLYFKTTLKLAPRGSGKDYYLKEKLKKVLENGK